MPPLCDRTVQRQAVGIIDPQTSLQADVVLNGKAVEKSDNWRSEIGRSGESRMRLA
jgi:hypothetical protein